MQIYAKNTYAKFFRRKILKKIVWNNHGIDFDTFIKIGHIFRSSRLNPLNREVSGRFCEDVAEAAAVSVLQ